MVDFPAAGRPDEGEGLPGPDGEVDVGEHGLGRVVAEGHVLEGDLAVDRRQLGGVGALGDARLCGEELVEPHDRGGPCW